MPATSCPHCGATTRVALATPDWMRCQSCRYQGAPPDEVRRDLHAAAQALGAVSAQNRQLSWAQRRLGAGSRSAGGSLLLMLALTVLPFAACGGTCFGLVDSPRGYGLVDYLVFFGPVAFLLIGGSVVLARAAKQRQTAELAAAAEPPAVPGEPFGCHVCGADLPPVDATRTAIGRCRYCAADNVVRPEIAQRAAHQAVSAAQSLFLQVQQHAGALAYHQGRARRLLVVLAVFAPLSSCAGIFGVSMTSTDAEPTHRYAQTQTPNGVCVAELTGPDVAGPGKYHVLGDGPSQLDNEWEMLDVPPAARFLATALVGKEVRYRTAGKLYEGKVERAWLKTGLDLEYLSIVARDGGRYVTQPPAVCLVAPLPGLAVTPWPVHGAGPPPSARAKEGP